MPRRACPVTESTIARIIRAARKERARIIRIDPDGAIWIDPNPGDGENPQLAKERLALEREAVL